MSKDIRASFGGHDRFTLVPTKSKTNGKPKDVSYGHPVSSLLRMMEFAVEEHRVLSSLSSIDFLSIQPGDQHEDDSLSRYQYIHPFYYFAASLPPCNGEFTRSPILKRHFKETEALVFSGQSFYYAPSSAVVSEEWFLARLGEVLTCRGHTPADFLSLVDQMRKRDCDFAFHECLRIVNHVLRMHTCSRPYVPDHTRIDKKMVAGDQETLALQLPGDCEDSACTVYFIHMQLLRMDNPKVHTLVKTLRSCAAVLGVPCSVSGTFVDPAKFNDHGTGHLFPVAIPFMVFARALGPHVKPSDVEHLFQNTFGFPLPKWHHRIAVLEGVFRTSMFYSDHRNVTKRKQQALDATCKWLFDDIKEDRDIWCWEHYTCSLPMGKTRRAQGHAFRLFTEILDWMPLGETIYAKPTPSNSTEPMSPCRSFTITSNLDTDTHSEIELLDQLFPLG